jgi:hypothetical protein
VLSLKSNFNLNQPENEVIPMKMIMNLPPDAPLFLKEFRDWLRQNRSGIESVIQEPICNAIEHFLIFAVQWHKIKNINEISPEIIKDYKQYVEEFFSSIPLEFRSLLFIPVELFSTYNKIDS